MTINLFACGVTVPLRAVPFLHAVAALYVRAATGRDGFGLQIMGHLIVQSSFFDRKSIKYAQLSLFGLHCV